MPGKHNAGGCGCCGAPIYPCFENCQQPTSLELTGFSSGNPCNPLSHSGTYLLNFNLGFCSWRFYGIGNELFVEDCGADYDFIQMGFVLTIRKFFPADPYRYDFSIVVTGDNYDGGGLDRGEFYDYLLITNASDPCPSGTINIPSSVFSNNGVGVPLGVTPPSSVDIVFP